MRFSIVIPAYNYAHVLARAVESACTQPGDDYEVLVIDDGSTDDTADVLACLQKKFSRLRVITQANAGLAAVRNRGIDESVGNYLIFLDADDEFESNALAIFRRAIVAKPESGMLIAPTLSVFEDGRIEATRKVRVAADAETRFLDFLYKRLPISNGAVAMHRKVFSHIRYNPQLRQTEDIPVFAHCLANFDACAVELPTTKIHKHGASMRHDVATALKLGMSLVDQVFDESRLPGRFMQHKQRYQARRGVSLFRLLYRAKRYREARQFYRMAFMADWRESISKPEYVFKYLRSVFAREGK